jgi:KaiC/GvpD/RAD55 family RecA-like ATPase
VLYGIPLSGASMSLVANSCVVDSAVTGLDGTAALDQVPKGNYSVRVIYMSYHYETQVFIDKSFETLVAVEVPYLGKLPYVAMLVAGISAVALVIRRVRRPRDVTIEVLDDIVVGRLPQAATVMILGSAASGKTTLLETLMHTSLNKERSCVFITTMQFPSQIRDEMNALGLDVTRYEKEGRLEFIDCYSAAAGQASKERYSVTSVTDLTRLGTELSMCLHSLGKETDVFLDSLGPWTLAIKSELIVSFVHATGAKIKTHDGGFYFTLGAGVDPELVNKLDEASDIVIELTIVESERIPRKLMIRKVRGRKHSSRRLDFSIIKGKGIVLHLRGKVAKS